MSICVSIDNPSNSEERAWNMPIFTESLYKQTILPIAEQFGLSTIASWGVFAEINAENIMVFEEQLAILIENLALDEIVSDEGRLSVLSRLNNLRKVISNGIEKNPKLVFLIG